MRRIELFRLRRVRDKPAALALIARHAALPPEQARAVLHAALGGGRPQLALPDNASAQACIAALAATGFIARFAPGPGFDPAAHAQAALQASWPHLLPPVADTVAAHLLQDNWPAALEHALLHLRMHASGQHPARQQLEQAALACGLCAGQSGRA